MDGNPEFVTPPVGRTTDVVAPPVIKKVSWGAIFVGSIVALAVLATLALLGMAVGLGNFNATRYANPLAGVGVGTGIWWLIISLIAFFVGGWASSRLITPLYQTENVLHGIASWAVGTVGMLLFATTAVGMIVGGALGTVSNVLRVNVPGSAIQNMLTGGPMMGSGMMGGYGYNAGYGNAPGGNYSNNPNYSGSMGGSGMGSGSSGTGYGNTGTNTYGTSGTGVGGTNYGTSGSGTSMPGSSYPSGTSSTDQGSYSRSTYGTSGSSNTGSSGGTAGSGSSDYNTGTSGQYGTGTASGTGTTGGTGTTSEKSSSSSQMNRTHTGTSGTSNSDQTGTSNTYGSGTASGTSGSNYGASGTTSPTYSGSGMGSNPNNPNWSDYQNAQARQIATQAAHTAAVAAGWTFVMLILSMAAAALGASIAAPKNIPTARNNP